MAGLKGFFKKLLGSGENQDTREPGVPDPTSELPAEATSASATQVEDYSLDAGQTAAQLYEQVRNAAAPIDTATPQEELCGLHSGMTNEEMEQQLAYLYRRYNRAAASLDAKMNREAEVMLDAVVAMRKKYLGK